MAKSNETKKVTKKSSPKTTSSKKVAPAKTTTTAKKKPTTVKTTKKRVQKKGQVVKTQKRVPTKQTKNANTGYILGLSSTIAWAIPVLGIVVTALGIACSLHGVKARNRIATVGLALCVLSLELSVWNFIQHVVIL